MVGAPAIHKVSPTGIHGKDIQWGGGGSQGGLCFDFGFPCERTFVAVHPLRLHSGDVRKQFAARSTLHANHTQQFLRGCFGHYTD